MLSFYNNRWRDFEPLKDREQISIFCSKHEESEQQDLAQTQAEALKETQAKKIRTLIS